MARHRAGDAHPDARIRPTGPTPIHAIHGGPSRAWDTGPMSAGDDPVHRYQARTSWSGSTATGYDGYDRTHTALAPPADATLTLASDPAFLGDPTLLNPEQLLLLAASSCQLLSFLAVAARARVDVRSYEDEAEAEMPEADRPVRVTAITLRPRVVVGPGTTTERVEHLLEVAHRECFIASSLRTDIAIEANVVIADS